MTSDRGLAGAVHSNVNKAIRAKLEEKLAAGESLDNVRILCVGDKSRAFFQRFFPKQIVMVGSEIGRLPPTFNDAAKIANAILTSGYEFDKGSLLFNYYKNVASNETTEMPIYSQGKVIVNDFTDIIVRSSFFLQTLSVLQRKLLFMILLMLMLFNPTWSTASPAWSTIVSRRELPQNRLQECLLWTTHQRMLVCDEVYFGL